MAETNSSPILGVAPPKEFSTIPGTPAYYASHNVNPEDWQKYGLVAPDPTYYPNSTSLTQGWSGSATPPANLWSGFTGKGGNMLTQSGYTWDAKSGGYKLNSSSSSAGVIDVPGGGNTTPQFALILPPTPTVNTAYGSDSSMETAPAASNLLQIPYANQTIPMAGGGAPFKMPDFSQQTQKKWGGFPSALFTNLM